MDLWGTVASILTVLTIVIPVFMRYVVGPLRDHHKRLVALERRLNNHIQRAHTRTPPRGN